MTPEERTALIAECKAEAQKEALRVMEGWLLRLPELIGSLVLEKVSLKKAAEKLFNENPEFMSHQELVAQILKKFDAANPGKQFDELMKLSLPEIKQRIEQAKGPNVTTLEKPSTLDFKPSDGHSNGEL